MDVIKDMDLTITDAHVVIQKLQDENNQLKQLLRNRILPQQENASKLINEAILKLKTDISRTIPELRTEMGYFQKKIDDLSTLVAQIAELQALQENLDAEQLRMVASLPDDALPSTPRFSLTPKGQSSRIQKSSSAVKADVDAPNKNNGNGSKCTVDLKTPKLEHTKVSSVNKENCKNTNILSPSLTLLQNPMNMANLPITKVFPLTAKSPSLSLIVEESIWNTPQQRTSRKREPSEVASENRSKSVFDMTDASDISRAEADASIGRRKRRAAAEIKSFKEPSLKKKMRQKKT